MNNLFKRLTAMYVAVFSFLAMALHAYASDFGGSTLATGTIKLINDVTVWLLILAPIVGVVCVVFFLIRRSMADEMDEKKWTNRIKVAVVSTLGAILATGLINILIGYYQ
jgi:nitric oxide reductase large subunit